MKLPSILFFLLIACDSTMQSYEILGHLLNEQYYGEYVYLVPFKKDARKNIDSTLIKNGLFTFKGKIKEPEMYIIRMRSDLPMQELLIVKEADENSRNMYREQLRELFQKRNEYNQDFATLHANTIIGDFVKQIME
jgi:hypothetical protein